MALSDRTDDLTRLERNLCVWLFSEKEISEPLFHLSFFLDLVDGDDDGILPLLLHHTGKKTTFLQLKNTQRFFFNLT